MRQSKNPLAPKPRDSLSGGVGNAAGTTNPSTMYHDVSSAGNGVSVSSAAQAARPRVPTFYPSAREVIPCSGSKKVPVGDPLGEAEFPKKVLWQALFGKKQFLPLGPMQDNKKCPYFDASERWADDPTPVTLGSGFSNFFGMLLDLQRSMA
jgi:hypothetical protein